MRNAPNPKIFAAMAGVMFLAGAGAVGMQSRELEQQRHKVASLRLQARDEHSVQADLDKSRANLEQCEADLKHLEQGVPDFAYVPTFLEDLAKTGQSCGIAVTGVRPIPNPTPPPGTKPERKAYDELNIEVKGRGNYESVRKFISALSTFPKIVAAKTVTLAPKANTNSKDMTDQLDVVINLKAFVFPTENSGKQEVVKNG